MEKSYIKKIDKNYLNSIDFKKEQINQIYNLINQSIREKLYTKIHFPYHNLEHIERVLCYCIWILNEKGKNNEILENTDTLLYSALYHDCGRSWFVSNKKHGIAGANIAKEKLKNKFSEKELKIIELLIETHAKKEDIVDFKNYNFNKDEKKNIQILSNILKDADALDRNRIKILKFAQCNPNYLRTKEAKKIYCNSAVFLENYEKAKKMELMKKTYN